jgi:hypothetical protein
MRLTLAYNLDHAEALDAFHEAIAAGPDDPTTDRLWPLQRFGAERIGSTPRVLDVPTSATISRR